MTKITALTAMALLAITGLTACGGGGGGGGGGGSENQDLSELGTEIPEGQVVSDFESSGAWRIDTDMDYTSPVLPFFDASERIVGRSVSVVSGDYSDPANATFQTCDQSPPQNVDEAESDPSAGYCAYGETPTTRWFVNGSVYSAVVYCDGNQAYVARYTPLTDSPGLNFGSLAFTSDDFSDLNTNTGACGSLDDNTSTSEEPLLNGFYSALSVSAPYGGSRINYYFSFQSPLQTGTFTVGTDVDVIISSAVFGGTVDEPVDVDATSGSLTIDALGDYSAQGSFNLVTETGDTLSGTFSFDLQ